MTHKRNYIASDEILEYLMHNGANEKSNMCSVALRISISL